MKRTFWFVVVLLVSSSLQGEDALSEWAALTQNEFRVYPNIVYKRANGFDCKLDVIAARDSSPNRPTLMYIHGGGWRGGSKETSLLRILPYLARGMNVVNVEYRLSSVSLAPAAVEDSRCALRWVHANAQEYGFDVNRLVVSGHSAGGHLSLMTGMLTADAGFDNECPGNGNLGVAAVVNFYGITDVPDLLEGPNRKSYAVSWLGSLLDRKEIADRTSPLRYVRSGLPPILTIHGDADPTVPYQHAVQLHEALRQKGVTNRLLTIPGGKHGGFNQAETLKIQETIFSFLSEHGLLSH